MYERNFLLQMRHSPLAKSPPANLPSIPGVTLGDSPTKQNGAADAKAAAGKGSMSPSANRKIPGGCNGHAGPELKLGPAENPSHLYKHG